MQRRVNIWILFKFPIVGNSMQKIMGMGIYYHSYMLDKCFRQMLL